MSERKVYPVSDAAASRSLRQSTARRTAGPMPAGPTRQQGQFLAYIRGYMLLSRS